MKVNDSGGANIGMTSIIVGQDTGRLDNTRSMVVVQTVYLEESTERAKMPCGKLGKLCSVTMYSDLWSAERKAMDYEDIIKSLQSILSEMHALAAILPPAEASGVYKACDLIAHKITLLNPANFN